MFTLLRKLPWFEWVGILAVVFAVGTFIALVKNYGRMEEATQNLTTQNQTLTEAVATEHKAAVITDQAVFEYTYERELKVEEALGYRAKTLEEYFAARDSRDPPTTYTKPEAKGDVDVAVNGHQPTKTAPAKVVGVDTNPDPDAIAALVNGMRRTYCRAYDNRDTCPTKGNADGLPTK
jgi:hypothetical protein